MFLIGIVQEWKWWLSLKLSNTNRKYFVTFLIILFVFTISVNVLAIGQNNPITATEQQYYDGIIISVDEQVFELTADDVLYEVHVPQYVVLADLNIDIDQEVDVTGYLRTLSGGNIIYPTVINGITLEDLKPLDGTGKL